MESKCDKKPKKEKQKEDKLKQLRVKKREEKKRWKEKEAGHIDLSPGTMIKDYKVDEFIADGTFGRVVSAWKNDIHVAIKVIRPVKRYLESAEIECEQIENLSKRSSEAA